MGLTLIYIRIGNSIIDYRFYSKELAPVSVVDDAFIGLVIFKEKIGQKSDICILKLVEKEEDGDSSGSHFSEITAESRSKVVSMVNCTRLTPISGAWLKLEAHLASCVACELSRSHIFRYRFIKWLRRKRKLHPIPYSHYQQPAEYDAVIDCDMWINSTVEIQSFYSKQKIDYAWCYRMEGQAAKKAALEETMAWLSTLGGGYSALGDYFQHHAMEAGRISLKQLKIAVEMGDPIVAAKCKLFFAQSLMQRGYMQQSKLIIRYVYKPNTHD
ncbi:hypothetical protein FSP39_021149 [Pinctada imbricata]|uniref:Uncharacterized protein n=1 Tax=Pinctada imbricata TaxID=66713 RepID=A0AA88XI38_PINIB|nr:hypothetical protein FSP39_021149 [Pinctada imbricata]